MKPLLVFVLSMALTSPGWAGIGKISAQTGAPADILRSAKKLPGPLNASVESMDVISTRKGTNLNIDFIDRTKVKITENSRLVIDDFVFDPKRSDAGKLAMKVSMGTVRYASGQIAKSNPQRINIQTPTAAIAVRGTDFHMTVDEAGQSLVILVPSCRDEKAGEDTIQNCQTGKITVSNSAGTVELTEPFTASYIKSATEVPGDAVRIAIMTIDSRVDANGEINNNLIIAPPGEIKAQLSAKADKREAEKEEEGRGAVQRAVATKKEDTLPAGIVKVSTAADGEKTCHEKIRCIEFNPFVTFTRLTDSDHYAEVKMKAGDNLSLTISHNGDEAKLPWGPAPTSGNVIIIRQSK